METKFKIGQEVEVSIKGTIDAIRLIDSVPVYEVVGEGAIGRRMIIIGLSESQIFPLQTEENS